jgi:hypothetical protein
VPGSATRRRFTIFLAGVGAVALHLVDDSFLQPEPGTSADDHLASGLVPLALLGVLAAAYRRGRAGVRATIAMALGLFGLTAGAAEGGYHLVTVGPSGDDYTGLLAMLGGLLLLSLGERTAQIAPAGALVEPPRRPQLGGGRELHDQRRAESSRLVHPLEEPGGRDRVPGRGA